VLRRAKGYWVLDAGVAPVALVEERPATTWGLRSSPEKHSGLEERLDEP